MRGTSEEKQKAENRKLKSESSPAVAALPPSLSFGATRWRGKKREAENEG
jgi:hypothetical protein